MKISKAALISLCLTAAFLVGGAGYLLGLRSGAEPYRVTAERLEAPRVPRTAALPDEKININTADADALLLLPGIGEVRAREIVADREENGPFAAPEELTRVSGIGEATMRAVLDYITTAETEAAP